MSSGASLFGPVAGRTASQCPHRSLAQAPSSVARASPHGRRHAALDTPEPPGPRVGRAPDVLQQESQGRWTEGAVVKSAARTDLLKGQVDEQKPGPVPSSAEIPEERILPERPAAPAAAQGRAPRPEESRSLGAYGETGAPLLPPSPKDSIVIITLQSALSSVHADLGAFHKQQLEAHSAQAAATRLLRQQVESLEARIADLAGHGSRRGQLSAQQPDLDTYHPSVDDQALGMMLKDCCRKIDRQMAACAGYSSKVDVLTDAVKVEIESSFSICTQRLDDIAESVKQVWSELSTATPSAARKKAADNWCAPPDVADVLEAECTGKWLEPARIRRSPEVQLMARSPSNAATKAATSPWDGLSTTACDWSVPPDSPKKVEKALRELQGGALEPALLERLREEMSSLRSFIAECVAVGGSGTKALAGVVALEGPPKPAEFEDGLSEKPGQALAKSKAPVQDEKEDQDEHGLRGVWAVVEDGELGEGRRLYDCEGALGELGDVRSLPRAPRSCHMLVLHPMSLLRLAWDCLGCFLIVFAVWATPLELYEALSFGTAQLLQWIFGLATLYWTADLVLNFLFGFFRGPRAVLDIKEIANHYAQTWLPFDFSMVVLDWVDVVLGQDLGMFPPTLALLLRLRRLLRICKLGRLRWSLSLWTNVVDVKWARAGLLWFGLAMSSHILGASWCFLGETEGGWLETYIDTDASLAAKYWASVHWAVSQLRGSGQLQSRTAGEQALGSVCQLLALAQLAVFASTLAADAVQRRLAEGGHMAALRDFLRRHKVRLQTGIPLKLYLETAARLQARQDDEKKLQALFPEAIWQELMWEVRSRVVLNHHLMQVVAANSLECAKQLTGQLQVEAPLPGSVVFHRGQACTRARFVMQGELLYIKDRGIEEGISGAGGELDLAASDLVEVGTCFCEAALWMRWESQGSLLAGTEGELLWFDAWQVEQVLRRHPRMRGMVACYARWFAKLCERMRLQTDLVTTAFLMDWRQQILGTASRV